MIQPPPTTTSVVENRRLSRRNQALRLKKFTTFHRSASHPSFQRLLMQLSSCLVVSRLWDQYDLAEHLAFFHVLVSGTRIFQRKRTIHNRFQSSAENVLE